MLYTLHVADRGVDKPDGRLRTYHGVAEVTLTPRMVLMETVTGKVGIPVEGGQYHVSVVPLEGESH